MDDLRTLAERVRHLEMELKRDRHPSVPYKAGVEATRYGNTTARFIPLTTPLTSTSWDGDARSTTAKTLIDLSEVFGVPAGVKAILVALTIRDSASSTNDCLFLLSTNGDDNYQGMGLTADSTNDRYTRSSITMPCTADGDIYFRLNASGTNTMDVFISIWGYWL